MSTCLHCVRLACACGWFGYRSTDDDRPCPWCWRSDRMTALPVEHRMSSSKHYRAPPPKPLRFMVIRKGNGDRWHWACLICVRTGSTYCGSTRSWRHTYGNALRHCRNRRYHHKWALEKNPQTRRAIENFSKKGKP